MRWLRYLPGVLLLVALVGVPVAYAQWRERDVGNFRVVQDRVLYRSAQLSPQGLDRVVHDYGIRTIVSFRYADDEKGVKVPPDAWEEAACQRLGINYVRIRPDVWVADDKGAVPGEVGAKKFLEIVKNPAMQPVLVHCFKGKHRTGTHCALYRMECQGWSNADAIRELRDLGYDNIDKEDDVRSYLERFQPDVTLKMKP